MATVLVPEAVQFHRSDMSGHNDISEFRFATAVTLNFFFLFRVHSYRESMLPPSENATTLISYSDENSHSVSMIAGLWNKHATVV